MLSPRSRGKGGRRFPGRDGGRRKQKAIAWRKSAAHAVDDPSELSGDLIVLSYLCPFRRDAAASIYAFDQRLAGTGIRYHAELHGSRFDPVFTICVPAACAAMVQALIARLEKR